MIKLSAVVQLIDGFTGQPAEALAVSFLLDGKPVAAQAKQQAFYAFPDLDDGQYRLKIICRKPWFLDQEVKLQVPLSEPLVDAITVVTMLPGPAYPYPPGTTLIAGQVVAARQQPVPGVDVMANYQTARANAKTASTRSFGGGRHAGCFTLALRGNLAPQSAVVLSFSKSGLKSVQKNVTVQSGMMQCVYVEMQ